MNPIISSRSFTFQKADQPVFERATSRVFSFDVIRGILILIMTFGHSTEVTIDLDWIMASPERYPLLIPLVIVALFAQSRGMFMVVSGLALGYRLIPSWFNTLAKQPPGVAAAQIAKTTVVSVASAALIWPVSCLVDIFFDVSYHLASNSRGDQGTFFYKYNYITSSAYAYPFSSIVFCGAIVTVFSAIFVIPAFFVSKKIAEKCKEHREGEGEVEQPEQPEQAQTNWKDAFTAHTYLFALTFGACLLLLAYAIALLRYPLHQSVLRATIRHGTRMGWTTRTTFGPTDVPGSLLSFNAPAVTGNNGAVAPKADWTAFYYAHFMNNLSSYMMGFLPYGLHFLPGLLCGLVLALLRTDKRPIGHKKRVFWTISGSYATLSFLFFIIWVIIMPPDFKTHVPWRYNGSNFLSFIGIKNVEGNFYHTGPYELWLSTVACVAISILIHACEFSDAARRCRRADDLCAGALVPGRRCPRVPLRWLRTLSTYSAQVFCMDYAMGGFMLRFTRIWPSVLPFNSGSGRAIGLGALWLLCTPLVTFGCLKIIDLVTLGYFSMDFALVVVNRAVAALVTTVLALAQLGSPKTREDFPAWRQSHLDSMKRLLVSTLQPPQRLHTGVTLVQFFDDSERLGPKPRRDRIAKHNVVVEEPVLEM